MKTPTNTPFDKLLDGGIENDTITNFYGPAGSGKTNIALCAMMSAINAGKSVIYVDTEGSFSFDRFNQLGGNEEKLKKIIFLEPSEWKEQHSSLMKIEKMVNSKIGLIIVDSLVALYRLELSQENFQSVNKQLATQYSVLSSIARKYKIPVLVTNQVYGYRDGDDEKIELTSNAIAKYWSKALVELKKTDKDNVRVAILRKHRSLPEGKKIDFEITSDGLKPAPKFGIF